VFPKKINILDILEFYFQCCSLTSSTDKLSIVAGTLANGGICPLTGVKVLSPETVKNCLSMMHSCGMYDYSDEFAFRIGLPAKAGASGAVMMVIPNVMGICTFSPPLNEQGNSTRGVEFFHKLTNTFNFHIFDNLKVTSNKENPRLGNNEEEESTKRTLSIIDHAASGNLSAMQRLNIKGEEFSKTNYDKRTPLHLAASNGHLNVIKYLMGHGVERDINAIDRWMGTPYDDAIRGGHHDVAEYIQSRGGQSGIEIKMLN
jgi:glutaminase